MAPLGPFLGWSEVPGDPAYNTALRHPHPFPAERMHRPDPLYDIVVATDHNTGPVVPGRGSAIFLHCWRGPRRPTAGCIALARPDLVRLLALWRPQMRLVIQLDATCGFRTMERGAIQG